MGLLAQSARLQPLLASLNTPAVIRAVACGHRSCTNLQRLERCQQFLIVKSLRPDAALATLQQIYRARGFSRNLKYQGLAVALHPQHGLKLCRIPMVDVIQVIGVRLQQQALISISLLLLAARWTATAYRSAFAPPGNRSTTPGSALT